MRRRDFLKLLGAGAAVGAAGLVVPQKKIWQVPSNAPVARKFKTYRPDDIMIFLDGKRASFGEPYGVPRREVYWSDGQGWTEATNLEMQQFGARAKELKFRLRLMKERGSGGEEDFYAWAKQVTGVSVRSLAVPRKSPLKVRDEPISYWVHKWPGKDSG